MNNFKFNTALLALSLLLSSNIMLGETTHPAPENMAHEQLVDDATTMARKSLAHKARKERAKAAATKNKDAEEDGPLLTVKSAAKVAATFAAVAAWYHLGQYWAKDTFNKDANENGEGKSHLGDTVAKLVEILAVKLFIVDPLGDELKKFKKASESAVSGAWDYAASFVS